MMSKMYCDNPQEYCSRITNLIEKADSEWQNLWKSAVTELFESPAYSINFVNALLKVVEKAFKERTYNIRAEAFLCWQFFISKVEKHSASEKLLRVITIPLCASNHSTKIVLNAKLKTWCALLKTSTLSKWISTDKDLPSLLKILYGPHSLPTAVDYEDMVQFAGQIYNILIDDFSRKDDNSVILSYMPKVILSLSTDEGKQEVGKKTWRSVLDFISGSECKTAHFIYVMKTLESLLITKNMKDNPFFCWLISSLLCSFSPDLLIPNLTVITRCLFYSSSSDLTLAKLLKNLINNCKGKEDVLFDQLFQTLTTSSSEFDYKLQKCWSAIITAFCDLNKREIRINNSNWLLLFPVKFLHAKWHSSIEETLIFCFDNLSSYGNNSTINSLLRELNLYLSNSNHEPLSLFYASTCLCKLILQKSKQSDDLSYMNDTLLTIFSRGKSLKETDKLYRDFISRFLTCAANFLERCSEFSDNFISVIKECSEFCSADKTPKEIMQILSKYSNENENRENNAPLLGGNSNDLSTPPKIRIRGGLLSRSSEKKLVLDIPRSREPIKKFQSTFTDDDDVQFIAIKPKMKQSPMTDHQKEVAKEKSYIPALYEDLSQSQSHSNSMFTIPEPVTLISHSVINVDENAVSPVTCDDNCDEIPASLDFRSAIQNEQSTPIYSSRKSLFNDVLSSTNEHRDSLGSKGSPAVNQIEVVTISDESGLTECKSRTKRRNSRTEMKDTFAEPVKRSKKHSGADVEVKDLVEKQTDLSDKRRNSRSRNSIIQASHQEVTVSTDSESQNIFVPSTVRTPTACPLSPNNAQNSSPSSTARKRSLRSRSITPRSPYSTRKRKSLVTETTDCKKSNIEERRENEQRDEECTKTSTAERSRLVSRTEYRRSPIKTIETAATNEECNKDIVEIEDKNGINSSADSVIIIEDHPISAITIDSVTQSSVENVSNVDNLVNGVRKEDSTVNEDSQETTFFESMQNSVNVSSKDANECVTLESQKTNGVATNLSDSRAEISFNLQMSPAEQETVVTKPDTENVNQNLSSSTNVIVEDTLNARIENISELQESDEVLATKGGISKENTDQINEIETRNTEDSTGECVINNSSVTMNSRTSQMMKLIFGKQNIAKQKRKSSIRSIVSPMVGVNGNAASRSTTNSRTMKMLQVNGNIENIVKPSPSKGVILGEKIEKFKYTPKECTSPGILKKPNLTAVCSPKSPKSVNFAEQLTDTREYLVDGSNFSDSWSQSDDQINNDLLCEEEGTSQETLYPALHNCNDDIKNISSRLSLNQSQLDTLRRMGIDTVGQLASVNTIVGKSIPVGDNRIQRLRISLQAYDNDRKLKGLRAPSVRRKISYKSPEKSLDVSSIIEILDESEESGCESTMAVSERLGEESLILRQPTIMITKLREESQKSNVCLSVNVNKVESSSTTNEKLSPLVRITRSKVSPSRTDEIKPSSPTNIANTVANSPARIEEDLQSSLKSDQNSLLKVAEKVSDSPILSQKDLPSPSVVLIDLESPATASLKSQVQRQTGSNSVGEESVVCSASFNSSSPVKNDTVERSCTISDSDETFINLCADYDCQQLESNKKTRSFDNKDCTVRSKEKKDEKLVIVLNVPRAGSVDEESEKLSSPEIVCDKMNEISAHESGTFSPRRADDSSDELSMSIFSQDCMRDNEDLEMSTKSTLETNFILEDDSKNLNDASVSNIAIEKQSLLPGETANSLSKVMKQAFIAQLDCLKDSISQMMLLNYVDLEISDKLEVLSELFKNYREKLSESRNPSCL